MNVWHKSVLASGLVVTLAGCATREPDQETTADLERLPPTAAGESFITDNTDAAFYTEGPWMESTSRPGYLGENYMYADPGTGENHAVWNIETIQEYEVSAHWSSNRNRNSRAEYTIYHIDDQGQLVTSTVTVDQRQNGGEWVPLGIYRMSNLTGRVTLSDDGDGYVIADAIRFRPVRDVEDTDADGMPNWYEISYGLNPNDPSDADQDLDGDGLTNVEEFVSGGDPSVAESVDVLPETDTSVTLSWSPPTTREDGGALDISEIAYYEVEYSSYTDSVTIQVDDASQYFQIYGGDPEINNYSNGYVGSSYHALPPGNGEMLAEWSMYDLVPGVTYRLEANWTSGNNRSVAAPYTINFSDQNGAVWEETVEVDQTRGGGDWQKLLDFTPGSSTLVVEATNVPDGYVIADAVRVVPMFGSDAETITVDDPLDTSVTIDGLNQGTWHFRVRAVDSDGLKSRYTDPVRYEAM